MPRKKSAAKKAKELEAKTNPIAKDSPVLSEQNDPKNDDISSGNESESSDSEIEDEYGELLTENVETQIQSVMKALKEDPKLLMDPEKKFFDESETTLQKKDGDKPLYLKDYHRMNLLSGNYKEEEENEYGTVDGEKPFALVEREERNQLLADIKDAFHDEEDDEEDGFVKKKQPSAAAASQPIRLPDPSANAEEFLSSFLSNEAWIPKKNDKVIDLDQMDKDDEQDFDDAVENFERAYNFRYEDPNSAEIVSYARTQASLRRGKTNARKRARDKKHAEKEQEKHEVEQAVQRKKTSKVNKVLDRLQKIKEAVGDDVSDDVIERVFGESLMNDDFDDADWDSRMAEIYNEQYYGDETEKPEWDENDEIMADFKPTETEETEETSEKTKLKHDKKKEKSLAKKEKKSLKEKAQKIVEANAMKIQDEVEEERGRSKLDDVKFKYREVSPESFGLSTREIFLADDEELNKYYSIKKFAPYKPKELALKDKRKYTKKKQLQQWRREVFKDKNGPARQAQEAENEIWIPAGEEEEPKKKKAKKSKSRK